MRPAPTGRDRPPIFTAAEPARARRPFRQRGPLGLAAPGASLPGGGEGNHPAEPTLRPPVRDTATMPIGGARVAIGFAGLFVAQAAALNGGQMPTCRRRVAVRGTRGIGPGNTLRNARTGTADAHPGTGPVPLDGAPLVPAPADSVAHSRLRFPRPAAVRPPPANPTLLRAG
ncbi:hypothetical protein ACFQ7O_07110 [Streptomyces sp. NPDC056485]|uniref:hypothetical protein n=1 Tax=Streptomyces sp. NPDC056485 TaxID=3345834 RepID=UPI0036CEBD23